MSEDYVRLLDRVLSKLPKKALSSERFELPQPSSTSSGNKTTLHNFKEICDRLNRSPSHLMRFLTKEMATAGSFNGVRAVFQGRFDRPSLTRLLQIYCRKYVICPICKRPDTKIEKEGRFSFLICEACGARSSLLPT